MLQHFRSISGGETSETHAYCIKTPRAGLGKVLTFGQCGRIHAAGELGLHVCQLCEVLSTLRVVREPHALLKYLPELLHAWVPNHDSIVLFNG
jgi:hypothetical protein